MDFGSEYVLEEEDEEEEEEFVVAPMPRRKPQKRTRETYPEVHMEGFECQIMDFEEEELECEVQLPPGQKPKKEKKTVATNTLKLKMSSLEDNSYELVKRLELIRCWNPLCGAALSHIDGNVGQKWRCKFCGFDETAVDNPPRYQNEDLLYVEDTDKVPDMNVDVSDYKIIFVIDTSASMSEPMELHYNSASTMLKKLYKNMYKDNNERPPQEAKIKVTRLLAIKAAILTHLESLKMNCPERRVALVTFNDRVTIHGDGNKIPQVVDKEDTMQNFTDLLMIGNKHSRDIGPISESYDPLSKVVSQLEENGRTALGPAMTIAISMASSTKMLGSKVILCTDGYSNTGIGNVENCRPDTTKELYEDVISFAKTGAISISVISFDDCGLALLGKVATETGGIVDRIKATDADRVLGEELNRKTIAHSAVIKVITHQNLYVEDEKDMNSERSQYSYLIGNIQTKKSISFKFASKSKKILPAGSCTGEGKQNSGRFKEQPSVPYNPSSSSASGSSRKSGSSEHHVLQQTDDDAMPQYKGVATYPFQIQILYQDMKGTEGIRIWTTEKPVTKDRAITKQKMNVKTTVDGFMQSVSKKLLEEQPSDKDSNAKIKHDDFHKLAMDYIKELNELLNQEQVQNSDQEQKKLTYFLQMLNKVAKNGCIPEDVASYFHNRSASDRFQT